MDGGMIQRILVGVLLAATLLPTDEAGSFGGGDVLQGTDCCTSIVRGGIRGAVAFALPLAVGKGWGGAGRRKCRATQIPSPACGSFALAGGSEARPLLLRRLDSAAARAELSPATSVRASSGERGAGGGYSERANRGKESKRMVGVYLAMPNSTRTAMLAVRKRSKLKLGPRESAMVLLSPLLRGEDVTPESVKSGVEGNSVFPPEMAVYTLNDFLVHQGGRPRDGRV
ncbi:hypothetical protein T484DRAFT_1786801 [Baffinella frigidus]|nr:hypothetical protein T484DRAFT_1786801 [Cryptophyta sp. CCMP2293]